MADEEAGQAAVERILRMVSEGKVTPEQGAELLRSLPQGGTTGGVEGDPESDGFGRFRAGRGRLRRPGPPPPPRAPEGVGFDFAQLGRISRHVARRVGRELDNLERSARRGWLDEGDDDGRPEALLWTGPVPEDGSLALDVEVDNASVRVVRDPEAREITVAYHEGVVGGIVGEWPPPSVHLDGARLVVRQRQRGVVIRFALVDDRITIRLPAAVSRVGGTVQSQNGSVRVDGPDVSGLRVRTANGTTRVRCGDADEVEAHSTNGRVEVRVATARTVRASSRNGKVEVSGAVRRVDADAGNGKLVADVGTPDEAGTWRLSAGNGRVEVHLPPAPVGIAAQVRSAVGGVSADLDSATVRWLSRGPVGAEAEVTREAGPGAPTLTLEARATNGRIALSEDGGSTREAASV